MGGSGGCCWLDAGWMEIYAGWMEIDAGWKFEDEIQTHSRLVWNRQYSF